MRSASIAILVSLLVTLMLSACGSMDAGNASLRAGSNLHLVESVLPEKYRSTVNQTMYFSPDGSRIVVHSLTGIEVLATHSLKILTAFETSSSSQRWVKYLDSSAIAFDNHAAGELLFPNLNRQPLPDGTIFIRNDGRFVVTSIRNRSDNKKSDGVFETVNERQICALHHQWGFSVAMNDDYAAFGNRGNAVRLCELATGKLMWLHDPNDADQSTAVIDSTGQFLLVISDRTSFFGVMHGGTDAKLYRLPLVPERVLSGDHEAERVITARPVKTWDWHTSMRAAFSPDGKWLMITSKKRSELVRTDSLDAPIALPIDSPFASIHFSRDSRRIAIDDATSIYLAELDHSPQFAKLAVPGRPENFNLTDIAPDGSALLGISRRVAKDAPKRVMWRIEPGTD